VDGLTHTAEGRHEGPAHARLSGQAWAGNSKCIWHGFLGEGIRNPEMLKHVHSGQNMSGHQAEKHKQDLHLEKQLRSIGGKSQALR
jgi:hypothetical protein